ncbi:hypothetical protein SKAU_G00090140 [Synaphobranchus kaupii]|uniref:Uncharacterized protein n=1 Tax=Synaphobranchus kaupii TaxID=118154 RepID=A0A9Q1J6D2_SYNKA|nr:hypothetical protein SKAU_G00090140 [Synaphobranchus kaupii]
MGLEGLLGRGVRQDPPPPPPAVSPPRAPPTGDPIQLSPAHLRDREHLRDTPARSPAPPPPAPEDRKRRVVTEIRSRSPAV